jgi:hypothetical protein
MRGRHDLHGATLPRALIFANCWGASADAAARADRRSDDAVLRYAPHLPTDPTFSATLPPSLTAKSLAIAPSQELAVATQGPQESMEGLPSVVGFIDSVYHSVRSTRLIALCGHSGRALYRCAFHSTHQ